MKRSSPSCQPYFPLSRRHPSGRRNPAQEHRAGARRLGGRLGVEARL